MSRLKWYGNVSVWSRVRRKGRAHWTTVVALTAAGVLLGHWISSNQIWIELRYKLSQVTFTFTHRHGPLYPKRTFLVLVGDDEYWKGDLAGRVPIKRDYIAKLVRKLDAANAALVAIDFDFRSPTPDGSLIEHSDYSTETDRLCAAVEDVGKNRPIILPATLGTDKEGKYVEESEIFNRCNFSQANVHRGYIQLPFDLRQVPVEVDVSGGHTLNSFAEAVVAATDATKYALLKQQGHDTLPFGDYMPEEAFHFSPGGSDPKLLSAGDVLAADTNGLRSKIASRIVIVGGDWSERSYHSGRRVDVHLTPAGDLPGAFIHANYVEALLNDRTYNAISDNWVVVLEVVMVLAVALVLGLTSSLLLKAATIVLATLGCALFSYFSIQNLGLFFDFFVPVFVLTIHVAVDKVLEWRRQAHYNVAQLNETIMPLKGVHP